MEVSELYVSESHEDVPQLGAYLEKMYMACQEITLAQWIRERERFMVSFLYFSKGGEGRLLHEPLDMGVCSC